MCISDVSSDVCSSDLQFTEAEIVGVGDLRTEREAALGRIERIRYALEIGVVGRTINRCVAAKGPRDFPAPVVRQFAAQTESTLPGIGSLEELARAGLGEAALDEHDILPRRVGRVARRNRRSEEHTSELQSLMRISYAVFCLKKKKNKNHQAI